MLTHLLNDDFVLNLISYHGLTPREWYKDAVDVEYNLKYKIDTTNSPSHATLHFDFLSKFTSLFHKKAQVIDRKDWYMDLFLAEEIDGNFNDVYASMINYCRSEKSQKIMAERRHDLIMPWIITPKFHYKNQEMNSAMFLYKNIICLEQLNKKADLSFEFTELTEAKLRDKYRSELASFGDGNAFVD